MDGGRESVLRASFKKVEKEIPQMTYSRSRGLFAGIDLDGTVLAQNDADTKTMYGSDVPFARVLEGNQPALVSARPFVSTVAKEFASDKKSKKS